MIRVVIVDDELFARETLEVYVKRFPSKVELVGMATNAEEGFEVINREKPDVVFLDVEMPGGNGFDLLGMFDEISFYVIFTTAYDYYAIRAIKYSALDYVLKPVHVTELERAIDVAIERKKIDRQLNVKTLLEQVENPDKMDKIVLPSSRDTYQNVLLSNILYLMADGSYTVFTLLNGDKVMTSKNLKEYEDLLIDKSFVRVHKSYIINLIHITEYVKSRNAQVKMTDGTLIGISRLRKEDFLKKFQA